MGVYGVEGGDLAGNDRRSAVRGRGGMAKKIGGDEGVGGFGWMSECEEEI